MASTAVRTEAETVNLTLRPRESVPSEEDSGNHRIEWAEDTIDNEFLNRRKSKSLFQFFVIFILRVLRFSQKTSIR